MDIDVVQVENQSVAFIRRTIPVDEMSTFYDASFGEVARLVEEGGGQITGAAFGWYHGPMAETVDVAAGYPVDGVPPGSLGGEDVMVEERIGGRAAVCMHVGPYDALGETYEQAGAWIEENKELARDDMWEEYLTDPSEEPDPSKWETRIVIPLR